MAGRVEGIKGGRVRTARSAPSAAGDGLLTAPVPIRLIAAAYFAAAALASTAFGSTTFGAAANGLIPNSG